MTGEADFLDSYADSLGVPRLASADREILLDLARIVAHGTVRPHAPVATFLAGLAVAAGAAPTDALAAAERLLSPPTPLA